ncbi:MAG: phospho-N-acetylmuramoyl-pentapeptide-transferase [Actinomycetota bacterium]|nr:MAG: phospho-N-acetylmuramoyl-pentapeptide-transferase [Actinomycetota bacterium]
MRLIVVGGGLSILVSLFGTPLLIRFLRRHGYAQAIRVSTPDEPYPQHEGKRGTPSMGGLAILVAVLAGYLGVHLLLWRPPSASGLLCLFLMIGLGLVGMADDYLKIFKQRSTGIRASTKLAGQAAVAVAFALLSVQFEDASGNTPASMAVSYVRDSSIVLPLAVFVVWVWFLVTATTNGVNLTDGLDGLATGASLMTFAGYILLGVWQYNQACTAAHVARCYDVRDPLDLAVFAAACAGATFGFLWHNTAPAKIFMGDTGSLALGGAIAALAIFTRTELLLPLMAGLFLLIVLSVIGQVGSYKLTGRRMFRMAPLHHHFEMLGWPEIQIVVRFWIIQGLCIGAGLTLFYAEWVA